MDLGLKNKVAMVAAGSKGIGRAAAASLASEGCRVSICARSEETVRNTAAELSAASGSEVVWSICDVSNADDIARWHREANSQLGVPDILVTNTGGPPAARFMQLTEEQWHSGIDSTLMNIIRMSRLVIPAMQARKWGRIVHITSLVAKQPVDLLTISSTLRAGISGLTKTMATQLAPDNVLVNAVLPGHVLTDRQVHLGEIRSREEGISIDDYLARAQQLIPIRRFGTPQELGDVIAFLCSERASFVTGTSLQVDGGQIQSTF